MQTTFPTPGSELNSVLQDLVDCVQAVLGNNFVGAYLQGSFAAGDFDLYSDVDFVVVIEEELSPSEVHGLQTMHEHLYRLAIPWAQHLEGSYFPKTV
jgi:predicted nucleotidyltransferase